MSEITFKERVKDRSTSFLLGAFIGAVLAGSLAAVITLMFATPKPQNDAIETESKLDAYYPTRIIVEIIANVPTEVFEVTAYTAGPESTGKTPDHPAYGITASGAHVEEGVTAACPPSLPFGTRLLIEGVGWRVCQDRGAVITEGKIDIYMEDLDEALTFGRRELDVVIIEKEASE